MCFNSSKCYILCMNRSKVKPAVNYFLDGQPLSLVDSHTYLGVTISSDLHWQNHTSNISAKASRILNFVRRNVYGCSAEAKATAYTTLVRPLLEFSSAASDPYLAKDIHQLECVQRRAARFVMNDYRRTISITSLLNQLEWSSLSVCRKNSRLVAFYKAVNNLSSVPVGQQHPCSHQIRSYNPLTFTPLTPRTDYRKYSFLPRTIVDLNSLPFSLRAKPSVDSFRAAPHCLYIISLSRTTTLQQ